MAKLLEKFAAFNIMGSTDTPLYHNGWMSFVSDITKNLEEREEIKTNYRFYPDLWTYDSKTKQIICFEIEDTSALTFDKLAKYYLLSEHIFDNGWRLDLFVSDRYGCNLRQIDYDNAGIIMCYKQEKLNWGVFNKYRKINDQAYSKTSQVFDCEGDA